jgi:hypothetical protein
MRAILSTLILLVTTVCASAEKITLHAPFSATGSYQALIRNIDTGLKAKGWDINIKITSNPKLSRDTYLNAKEPFILAWGTETSGSKSDPHYITPANNANMIGFTHITGMYLCSTKHITVRDFKNNSYKIAITQDAYYKNWIESWQDHMGTKHTFIQYKGSSKVENALFSGEVDLSLNSKGASYVAGDKAKCLFTTGPKELLGIPTVKSAFPEYKDSIAVHGMYWRAKNFSDGQLEKFRKDFADVIRNHKTFTDYTTSNFYLRVLDNIDSQVKLVQDLDSKLD